MFTLSEVEIDALWLSLKVAFWAVGASLLPAYAVAHLLARHRFIGHGVINAIVHLPLVLPPVVVGYGLLVLLGRRGPLGAPLFELFGVSLAFTWQAAAIAAAVMAFPLTVRAIRLSIEAIDPGLEAAARTLGASFWRVQLTIVLPLALPGVLTGVVLGFARCLGEFGATITFAANIPGQTQTLPLALFSLTEAPGNDMAAARLAVIGVALAMIALLSSEVMARRIGRRLGRQTRYSP